MNRSVTVFCGSHDGHDATWRSQMSLLGHHIAANGIDLVFGGSRCGLMGYLALSALRAGGAVVGVLPRCLVDEETALVEATELLQVDSMHERKQVMLNKADALVVGPGGYGTLEELLEVVAYRRIHLHDKPIFILNVGNYYGPLREQFRVLAASGFAESEFLAAVGWYKTVNELMVDLIASLARGSSGCDGCDRSS